MKIPYVCFNITSICNMKCPYCYRVGNTLGSVKLDKAIKYINSLKEIGCSTINITGGEPLLNTNCKEIIQYCKQKGLFVILSTNGTNLNLNNEILSNIDVLSLPLDGPTPQINQATRDIGHYENVQNLISSYSCGNYKFGLKINTVITKNNINFLDKIHEQINYSKIVWKLFELREKGAFYSFNPDWIVSSDEISDAINKLFFKKSNCRIHFMGKSKTLDNSKMDPNYFVLNYNGDVYFSTEREDILLTNLDNKNVLDYFNSLNLYNINNQYQKELKNDYI